MVSVIKNLEHSLPATSGEPLTSLSFVGEVAVDPSAAACIAADSEFAVPPLAARRPSSREAILDAAEAVVMADGAAHLTLDAVAERAKVSKGGLLYNFKSKDALLHAMIDRQVRRIEASRLQAMEGLPPQPGRELKACVLMAADTRLNGERRLGCATLAATAHSPEALAPVRAANRRRLDWITEGSRAAGLPWARSAVIALAVDGLCLLEIVQLSPLDAAQRERVIADLLQLVDETAAAAQSTQP